MILSSDTETTGIDIFHGCHPFLVTLCEEGKDPEFWPWVVDPLTRKVQVVQEDLDEIAARFDAADEIVWQNGKFDITALGAIGFEWRWWDKTHDTLFAGHILASGEPHDLTTMVLRYLRIDIRPFEDALEKVIKEFRTIAKREFPNWKIIKDGMYPSAKSKSGAKAKEKSSEKDKLWKWDLWLGRAIADAKGLPSDHRYRTCTPEYACVDSGSTLPLWIRQKQLLKERGLWKIYLERRKLIRIVVEMETRGVTYSRDRMEKMLTEFQEESHSHERICLGLAGGALESLPKSGTTKAMRKLLIEDWKLQPLEYSPKTQEPSIDKVCLEHWENILPARTRQHTFVKHLRKKRKKDSAVSYMQSYKKYGLPSIYRPEDVEYPTLHASLNPTGSNTLRWTHNNPNEANISKLKDQCPNCDGTGVVEIPAKLSGVKSLWTKCEPCGGKGITSESIRHGFGPADGREWWSLDYENVELRIPAYESGEKEMIDLFEHPDAAPYFGSYHLLICHILWHNEFEQCLRDGVKFKNRYKDTLYQWTKNGDFAVVYGAVKESGTADAAYHQIGAQAKIEARFSKLTEHNNRQVDHARRHGFVYTTPDKECGGYPLQAGRGKWGGIRPTTPLNYRTSGAAMWCMGRAMVRTHDFLQQWNLSQKMQRKLNRLQWERYKAFITLQIHDELVFDLPAALPQAGQPAGNLAAIMKVRSLMEKSGEDIGVPLKVDIAYHPHNWSEAESFNA